MGWGTACYIDGTTTRKVQAYVSGSVQTNGDGSVTISATGYCRSGDGSGYYYAYDYGVYTALYYRVGTSGNWTHLGNSSTTILNYGSNVASVTKTFTVNKDHSSKTVQVMARPVLTGSYINAGSSAADATANVSVSAKTSYTVAYNANGGTGAPSNQTKWYGETLTLSSTSPTRTGYTFQGWATSSSATSSAYSSGGSYTTNSGTTLYAVWKIITYTISYDGNKPGTASGSVTNVPSSQTKNYGEALTLTSSAPSLDLYNFMGWNTLANGTGTHYSSGGTYPASANSNATLWAEWEIAYIYPKITSMSVARCDSSGTVDDEGKYALVTVNWSVDTTTYPSNTGNQCIIKYKATTASSWTTAATISLSNTSGTVSQKIGTGTTFPVTTAYIFEATVTDNFQVSSGIYGSTSKTATMSQAYFAIAANANKGVAIGGPANTANLFDVKMNTSITGTLSVSGNSTFNNSAFHKAKNIYLDSSNITNSSTHESSANGNSRLYLRDSANLTIGCIVPYFSSNGKQYTRINCTRVVANDETVDHSLFIGVDPSGNKIISLDADAWLSALGLDTVSGSFTADTTNWTASTTQIKKSGKVVTVTLTGRCKAGIGTWSGDTGYPIGTVSFSPSAWTELHATLQISSKFVPMECHIATNGIVYVRTAGESVPAGTWTWIGGTFITD